MHSCKSIEKILNVDSISWILVNDGSTKLISSFDIDRISSEVDNFQYFNLEKNRGKGFATRHGVDHSNADYTIYTDVDFPYLDENVLSVYQALLNGSDLVLATRNQNYYKQISSKRAWISRNFRSAVKMLFNIPTTDTQAGLKGLSSMGKKALLDTKIDRYLFDLELVKICAKRKLNITEVEATLKHDIDLPGVSLKILSKEVVNLVRIFFGL
ncbi:MAG: glycosyltransferase [Saprospiraceae bacterium]